MESPYLLYKRRSLGKKKASKRRGASFSPRWLMSLTIFRLPWAILGHHTFGVFLILPRIREVKIPATEIPARIVNATLMPFIKPSTGIWAPERPDMVIPPRLAESTDVAMARLIA